MIMKPNISRRNVSFSIFLVIILFLVTGVHSEEQKCVDVSGTWERTEEIDNSDCGFPNQTTSYTYELIQNGCVVTVKGKETKAVVRGDRIYWPLRTIPGRPAGFAVTLEVGVSQVSGNKATGERSWTRTDGTISCSGTIVWTAVKRPPKDPESASTVPAPTHRDRLGAEELFGDKSKGDGPVQNKYFMPTEDADPALHEFSGTLAIASTKMFYRHIWMMGSANFGPFPEFKANFFTYQDHLVPVERNKLLKSEKSTWNIILAPGRIWSEPGDDGYSRASFPFTLIHSKSIYSRTHNGIATFLFDDKHVSALRFQIVQEAAPQEKFDAWGQADMKYLPAPLADRIALTQQFVNELAHQTPIRSWAELEQTYDPNALDIIDNTSNRENIALSGLIIDDVVYARACRTRYGDYPYCAQMRHGVYSASKSLGAMLGMLRLAQKYGDEVFDLKIKDYVDIASSHAGWNNVTFGDTLNMATGIGDIEPRRVSSYVEEDSTALAGRIYRAQTTNEKLKLIAAFGNYPWGPGEVFRYRTTDTFVLAVAMDRFIKSKEGPSADLWNLMSREVFEPIGITRMPVLRTKEPNHAPGIPKLEGGMLPNLDEVAKLVKLLRHGGRHQGEQILSATKLDEAIGKARPPGLPTGWRIDDGETYYHMSLWLHPFLAKSGCRVRIPAMSGGGGTYVIIMPNGISAFRFADGRYNDPGTWDSSGLRKVADYIRPFCKKSIK
jgi:CubicO group peptidase (beta-lactamase class C family)